MTKIYKVKIYIISFEEKLFCIYFQKRLSSNVCVIKISFRHKKSIEIKYSFVFLLIIKMCSSNVIHIDKTMKQIMIKAKVLNYFFFHIERIR